ncbi:MAG: ROK family protein [Clostridia bacterium]|nr:ROK family protein [Clostridia bacterium]
MRKTQDFSQNLGIACAGAIDKSKGVVLISASLKWTEVPLKKMVEEKIGMSMSVINDADAALLTEMKFGAGKEYTDAVLLTLGTGIGSSIFNKGKFIEPIELSHMVIKNNGKKCACGRKGCFETYCSASALKTM